MKIKIFHSNTNKDSSHISKTTINILELKKHGLPNVRAVDAETAGVEVLLANWNPVPKEVVEAVDAELPTPKPANDGPLLADDDPAPLVPAATGATDNENPLLAGAEDPATVAPKAGTEAETIAAPVVVVEAVVVVTVEVENNGADDVVNEKELAGLAAADVPDTEDAATAGDEDTLPKPKAGWEADAVEFPNENPDELEEFVAVIVLTGAEGFEKSEKDVVAAEEVVPPKDGVEDADDGAPNNGVEAGAPNDSVEEADDGALNDGVEEADDGAPKDGVDEADDANVNPKDAVDEAEAAGAPNDGIEEADDGAPNDGIEEADDGAPNDGVEADDAATPNDGVDDGAPNNGVEEAEDGAPNDGVDEADEPNPNAVEVAGDAPPNIVVEAVVEPEAAPPNSGVEADEAPPKIFPGVEGVPPPNGEPAVAEPKMEGADAAAGVEEPGEAPNKEEEDPKLKEEGAVAVEVGFVVVEKGEGEDPNGEDPNENADVEDDDWVEDEDPNGKPDIVASEKVMEWWWLGFVSVRFWKWGGGVWDFRFRVLLTVAFVQRDDWTEFSKLLFTPSDLSQV